MFGDAYAEEFFFGDSDAWNSTESILEYLRIIFRIYLWDSLLIDMLGSGGIINTDFDLTW